VDPIEVDHGQFQVAIKWCGFDAEPIHSDAIIKRRFASGLDCSQYPVLLRGQIRTLPIQIRTHHSDRSKGCGPKRGWEDPPGKMTVLG
jgi:hypothetical protein